MKKFLAIVVLGLLTSCGETASQKQKKAFEEYGKIHRELKNRKNEKSLSCKKEIKDLSGANAIEAYEKCMKKR